LHFMEGDMFPTPFDEGAFVAFHGSRFDAEPTGQTPGYSVGFVRFDEEAGPDRDWTRFAIGFAGEGTPLPEAAQYRPVGFAEAPDGSLYISDDQVGRVWRVFYGGDEAVNRR
jgi:glucose/arabinose dehydrogenase